MRFGYWKKYILCEGRCGSAASHKFCGKGEIGLKLVNQAGLDLRYGVVDTAAAFDQVFIVGFTTGELTESSGILPASFQQIQTIDQRLIGRKYLTGENLVVQFLIGGFFLLRNTGKRLDLFGKDGGQVIIVRVFDKCAALTDDAVCSGITHESTVLCFQFFKRKDAFEIAVYRRKKLQVIPDIVFFSKSVFCEKNGELSLGPEGGTQGFIQKILPGRKKLCFVVKRENLLSQPVIGTEISGGKGIYHGSPVFKENLLTGELCGIEGSEREGIIFDAGGFRVGKCVVKVKRIAGYVGGEDGVGTGAEAAIDEVGVGKRAHHKKGQKTDQKQKGDEEFFGKFRIMHRTP